MRISGANRTGLLLIAVALLSFTCQANLIRYGTFALSGDFPQILSGDDFTTWTGVQPNEVPDGWGLSGASSAGNYVTENPAGQCQFISDGSLPLIENLAPDISDGTIQLQFECTARVAGTVNVDTDADGGDIDQDISATGIYTIEGASGTRVTFRVSAPAPNANITFNNILYRKTTPWKSVNDWDLATDGHATYVSSSNNNQGLMEQSFTSVSGGIYKVSFTVTNLTFANNNTFIRYMVGGGTPIRVYDNIDQVVYVKALEVDTGGFRIRPNNDITGDTFDFTNLTVTREFTTSSNQSIAVFRALAVDNGGVNEGSGPNGVFTKTGDINDGKSVWDSVLQTANGLGTDVTWHIWYNSTEWVIGTNVGTVISGDWTVTSASNDPSGLTYTATGNSLGSAVTFNIVSSGTSVSGTTRDRIRYSGSGGNRR